MSDDSQTWSLSLDADSLRPVEEDVVLALDTALERFGPVYHLLDPVRIKTFSAGGPPVWSIGYTRVDGDEGERYVCCRRRSVNSAQASRRCDCKDEEHAARHRPCSDRLCRP